MLSRTLRHVSKRRISPHAHLPASRYVCFESMIQHLHDYSSETPDLVSLRVAAYRHCAIQSKPPSLLLLEIRQRSPVDNTTTRRLANVDELVPILAEYAARRLGLRLSVRHFGRLSYCEQVRIARVVMAVASCA